jgi:predicted heme/steroid binding protein
MASMPVGALGQLADANGQLAITLEDGSRLLVTGLRRPPPPVPVPPTDLPTRRVAPLSDADALPSMSLSDLGEHMLAIHGTVFEVSDFLATHPGGRAVLIGACGADVTAEFDAIHRGGESTLAEFASQLNAVGRLKRTSDESGDEPSKRGGEAQVPAHILASMEAGAAAGRTGRMLQADLQGGEELEKIGGDRSVSARELASLKNLPAMEQLAMDLLPRTARLFVQTGAESGRTTTNNREAWGRWALVPRSLRDVSAVSTEAVVLGHHLALPVIPGPASFHDRVRPYSTQAGAVAPIRGLTDAQRCCESRCTQMAKLRWQQPCARWARRLPSWVLLPSRCPRSCTALAAHHSSSSCIPRWPRTAAGWIVSMRARPWRTQKRSDSRRSS